MNLIQEIAIVNQTAIVTKEIKRKLYRKIKKSQAFKNITENFH